MRRPFLKRPFLLVEALIAIALLLGAGSLFFYGETKKAATFLDAKLRGEAERMHGIALSQLIVQLHDGSIPFDEPAHDFETGFTGILNKNDRWQVSYAFEVVDDATKKTGEKGGKLQSIRVDVTINLKCSDNSNMKAISFPNSYRFCMKTL